MELQSSSTSSLTVVARRSPAHTSGPPDMPATPPTRRRPCLDNAVHTVRCGLGTGDRPLLEISRPNCAFPAVASSSLLLPASAPLRAAGATGWVGGGGRRSARRQPAAAARGLNGRLIAGFEFQQRYDDPSTSWRGPLPRRQQARAGVLKTCSVRRRPGREGGGAGAAARGRMLAYVLLLLCLLMLWVWSEDARGPGQKHGWVGGGPATPVCRHAHAHCTARPCCARGPEPSQGGEPWAGRASHTHTRRPLCGVEGLLALCTPLLQPPDKAP